MKFKSFWKNKIHCSHTIRQLIQKWGNQNANDLIVDESVEEFESTRMNTQFQMTNFFNSPFGPQHNSFQFDEGYKYPNPATKVNYNKLHGTQHGLAESGSGLGDYSGLGSSSYLAQSPGQRLVLSVYIIATFAVARKIWHLLHIKNFENSDCVSGALQCIASDINNILADTLIRSWNWKTLPKICRHFLKFQE